MPESVDSTIESAEVVVPCAEIDPTLRVLAELGFRVEQIYPADAPRVAVVVGYGARLRLDVGADGAPAVLRLATSVPRAAVIAPNGMRIEFFDPDPPVELPQLAQDFSVTRLDDRSEWVVGRAGMRYRDLLPGREGGRFIASQISIVAAGPVADYEHFHRVRFQMIYCASGWVRVVYEDQGDPFVMHAGDCVLQPPQIRHRVLENSDDFSVIEIGSPAEHETRADLAMELPNGRVDTERTWNGQRFVRHIAAEATWQPWAYAGFEHRDTGIGAATGGLAAARVARPDGTPTGGLLRHRDEFAFFYVLSGGVTLCRSATDSVVLSAGDAVAIPAEMAHGWSEPSTDAELLEVSLPADRGLTPI